MSEVILTVKQAACRLGVAKATYLRNRAKFPPIFKVGAQNRVREADIDLFISKRGKVNTYN